MKRKTNKLISGLLAVAMLLSGCAGSAPAVSSSDAAPSASATQAANLDTSLPSWQRHKDEPIELEWFVAYDWISLGFDPENNLFDQYIYENSGVKIKFSTGSLDKLNTLIATDSLPDIVTYDAASTERLMMENNGLLLPLDELMPQYAPDLSAPQAMIDWYRNEQDGHWYAYVGYFKDIADSEKRGAFITSHNMNFARKDIMEQLGIAEADFSTQDGFIEALHKVKDAAVQYGGQTVIPYIGDDAEYLAEQMGADREDKEGNLLNIRRQPAYLEALLFLNRIYNEGLTTDEIFTMDSQLRKQMVTSGQVFAGTRHNYLNGKDSLFYTDPNALMIGVGTVAGANKQEPILSPTPMGGWAATMISKNCKNPERAAQLLALFTQQDVSLAYYYGGIDGYDMVDGKAVMKQERKDARSADPAAFSAKYLSDVQDLVCDYTWVSAAEPTEGLDDLMLDRIHYEKTWIDGHIFDNKIFIDVQPVGGTDLAAINTQLEAYWLQQFPQIVMAKSAEEATALYNSTIQQMDTMGMAELDTYQNERFQHNKQKMGLTFAWPRNQ